MVEVVYFSAFSFLPSAVYLVMDLEIISVVVGIAALALFLFIAARVLRLALKLMLAGVVIVALLTAIAVGWWQGWLPSAASTNKSQQRATPARGVSSH